MFDFIKFGEPYNNEWNDGATVMATLEFTNIIDPYDYHDFPTEEWLFLTVDSIDKAIEELKKVKKEMLEFENNKGV